MGASGEGFDADLRALSHTRLAFCAVVNGGTRCWIFWHRAEQSSAHFIKSNCSKIPAIPRARPDLLPGQEDSIPAPAWMVFRTCSRYSFSRSLPARRLIQRTHWTGFHRKESQFAFSAHSSPNLTIMEPRARPVRVCRPMLPQKPLNLAGTFYLYQHVLSYSTERGSRQCNSIC